MRLYPSGSQEFRPAAFITHIRHDALVIQTFGEPPRILSGKQQISSGLLSYTDYAVFSLVNLYELCFCGDPRWWKLYNFNSNHVRVEFGNISIYSLRGFGLDPLQLEPFFDFLASFGIRYAGLSTMAMSVVKRSLDRPLLLQEEYESGFPIGPQAPLAGLRRGLPGVYDGLCLMDIPVAFPSAMAQPFPTTLRPGGLWWYEHGLARASISIDETGRLLPYDAGKRIGVWSFAELRALEDAGYSVKLLETWQGTGVQDPLAAWFDVVLALRALPGQAGKLGKVVSNQTWGLFCSRPNARYTRTTFSGDGTPFIEVLKHSYNPGSAYFGALIAGNVRAKLIREGLRPGTMFCETDSVILPFCALNGWKRKGEISRLEMPSVRTYRYKCMRGVREHWAIDGCVDCAGDRWHYVAQGALGGSVEAEGAFRREYDVLGWGGMGEGVSAGRVATSVDAEDWGFGVKPREAAAAEGVW